MQQQSAGGRGAPIGAILAIVGGVALAIGSFLVWLELSGGGESQTATGMDADPDGWITLGTGIVAVVVGLVAFRVATHQARRGLAILAILAGLVGGGVGLYDGLTVRDQIAESVASESGVPVDQARAAIDQLIDSGQLDLSMGIGLYMVIGGGAVALIGGVLMLGGRATSAPAVPVAAGPMGAGAPAPAPVPPAGTTARGTTPVPPPAAPPSPPPPPEMPST